MPALPAASRKRRSGTLWASANAFRLRDDAVERLGAVVGEVGDDRHHRALGVEQVGVVDRSLLRRVVQDFLVARDRQPLRVAFERAGRDLARCVGEGDGGLHAGNLAQRPREAVGLDQRGVFEAAFLAGLDDDGERVARQRVVRRDVGVVAVVARLGAKLRRARVEVADPELLRDDEPAGRKNRGNGDRRDGVAPRREPLEHAPQCAEAPPAPLLGIRCQAARRGGGTDARVRQQHRQQEQVGDDQHADAEARGDREVADHRDVDDHQHREADRVGDQRGQAGEEQPAERVARGDQPVRAAADVLHDAVHLLRAVRHADREHEERHEDRVWVELEAQERDQAELPGDGDQRARHDQERAAHAVRVGIQNRRRDQRRDGEESHHLAKPVDQLADDLREADDVDPDVRTFMRAAHFLLERARKRGVVDALAGPRVALEQRNEHHARAEVAADQAADDARARDVVPSSSTPRPSRRRRRASPAAAEALLGHLGPAHRRRPERLHPCAVDARRQHQLVADALQRLEVARVEDVAVAILDDDAHGVAESRAGPCGARGSCGCTDAPAAASSRSPR
jgi:hypothetical protein